MGNPNAGIVFRAPKSKDDASHSVYYVCLFLIAHDFVKARLWLIAEFAIDGQHRSIL